MPYPDLFSLSIRAIESFETGQLSSSSYGPGGVPRPKDATYHHEMYRALHKILCGRVYATPEFGKDLDSHSIDLQITGVDWGIECMFEGRKLKDHVERFGAGRAYPLDRNGSQPIRAAHATTSPHVQKWSSEAILFIKSSLVANKTFCQSEL
jgi:hypothetical protein